MGNLIEFVDLKRIKKINDLTVYDRFVNWVSGEFDLYLQNETKKLQVFLPNGSFDIEIFNDCNNSLNILIHVKGKSKDTSLMIIKKLENIYNNVLKFNLK